MAIFYSDQYVSFVQAVPVVKLQTTDLAGRVRCARFTYTVPASAGPATGDQVYLTTIPWRARVWQTFLGSDAQASGALLQLGDGVTAARWGTSGVLTAATAALVFPTKSDYTTAVPTTIPSAASGAAITVPNMLPFIGTFNTAGSAANAVIYGVVFYSVD